MMAIVALLIAALLIAGSLSMRGRRRDGRVFSPLAGPVLAVLAALIFGLASWLALRHGG